ncbi:NADH dehydrogenase [ubiquinone] 1 beta subcomplex subunit 10 [Fasciola gigantica]|uniref:NADH dehydrogenase [ubiquinone] 1 beta subcomplex subunit 10 n=1 Tax=Fasciola gigantica TaxID=46835 RepID=A0A504YWK2_FASGI|nr:NADH dehydrogenase [ubiquinone] 1 beta subcomplex subunit 10 [Fasciola gigantica]
MYWDGQASGFRRSIDGMVRDDVSRESEASTNKSNAEAIDSFLFLNAGQPGSETWLVDKNILRILKRRRDECALWYRHEEEDVLRFCKTIIDEHEQAAVNYFIKYGELSWNTDVRHAFMKQKHRMLWERRNGPVGTGERSAVQKAVAAADKAVEKKTEDMFSILGRSLGSRHLPKEMRP